MASPRLCSNLKFLGQGGHLEALAERRVVAPVDVRIKPINHCNHNCWYCAYRVDNLQFCGDMDLGEIVNTGMERTRSLEDKTFTIVNDYYELENPRTLSLDPSSACRHHSVSHEKNLAILEQLSLDPDHACFV